MNKLLSMISLLIILSVTFTFPSFAASHEKKAQETTEVSESVDVKKMENSEDADKKEAMSATDEKVKEESDDKKEGAKGEEDEEPECD